MTGNNNYAYYQQNSQYSRRPHHHNHLHQHHHHHGENFHQQQPSHQTPDTMNLPPHLPPGWVEATDPSTGKIYYANPQTQETQWERPVIVPPLPPTGLPPPPHYWNGQARAPASVAQSYNGIGTNRATWRETGEGNLLCTVGGSATSNLAVVQPEKIVEVARSMLEKVQAFSPSTTSSDLELHSLNPGQIADLCKLQQRVYQDIQQEKQKEQRRKSQQQMEQQQVEVHRNQLNSESTFGDHTTGAANDDDEDVRYVPLPPYTPINPFTMPLRGGMLLDRAEPGRLDVRMNSLREELKAFGYAPSTRN